MIPYKYGNKTLCCVISQKKLNSSQKFTQSFDVVVRKFAILLHIEQSVFYNYEGLQRWRYITLLTCGIKKKSATFLKSF